MFFCKLTEQVLKDMVTEACGNSISAVVGGAMEQLNTGLTNFTGATNSVGEQVQTGGNGRIHEPMALRATNGVMSRLPADFCFPKGTAHDMWTQ